MTPQPMTLEETKANLQDRLENYQHDDRWRVVFQSALHHLEAGKLDTERLNWMEREEKGAYTMTKSFVGGPNTETHFEGWAVGFSTTPFPTLREALDYALSPTQDQA